MAAESLGRCRMRAFKGRRFSIAPLQARPYRLFAQEWGAGEKAGILARSSCSTRAYGGLPALSHGWVQRGPGAQAHVVKGRGAFLRNSPCALNRNWGPAEGGGSSEGRWPPREAGSHPAPCPSSAFPRARSAKPRGHGQQLHLALTPRSPQRAPHLPGPRALQRVQCRGPAPPRAARPFPRGGRSGEGAGRVSFSSNPTLSLLAFSESERRGAIGLSRHPEPLGKGRSVGVSVCPSAPSRLLSLPSQPRVDFSHPLATTCPSPASAHFQSKKSPSALPPAGV